MRYYYASLFILPSIILFYTQFHSLKKYTYCLHSIPFMWLSKLHLNCYNATINILDYPLYTYTINYKFLSVILLYQISAFNFGRFCQMTTKMFNQFILPPKMQINTCLLSTPSPVSVFYIHRPCFQNFSISLLHFSARLGFLYILWKFPFLTAANIFWTVIRLMHLWYFCHILTCKSLI